MIKEKAANFLALIDKLSFLLVVATYLAVNLIFFRSFWQELVFDRSTIGARHGEVTATEWAMEQVYQNIKSGQNPFAARTSMLYPFGTDFATTDSGYGLLFVFLRPFLSVHQAAAVVVTSGLFLASLGMYLLLRKMGLTKLVSFLIGLFYGQMTFLMVRMAHLTYTSIYVFPWFFYSVYSLTKAERREAKLLAVLGISAFFVLALYLNLYYFVMLVLSLIVFGIYFILFRRQPLFDQFKKNWTYLILALVLTFFFLSPWLTVVYQKYLFEGLPKTDGWGGAIIYSSDLFGYFIPSSYSYFLGSMSERIEYILKFPIGRFENFTYPGMLIIFSYLTLFVLFARKKVPDGLKAQILPYLFVSFLFWILTLGPFLHMFGKWSVILKENILVVIPLPYAFLSYLPLMANIRSPGRLIVAFIFFSYILSAKLLDHFLAKRKVKAKLLFSLILLLVFVVDHYFEPTLPSAAYVPKLAYDKIKADPASVTVLEAPSAIRDSFVYFGSHDYLDFIAGQMIHGKPTLGGYLGRISGFKKRYYQQNPFLGYVGRLMDADIQNNGGLDRSDLASWSEPDQERSLDAIDLLDLKYVLLKDDEFFSATMSAVLTDFGFKKDLQDSSYSLWERKPLNKEFLELEIGKAGDVILLGNGWSKLEDGYRWAGKRTSVMFKVMEKRKFDLVLTGEAYYKAQTASVYLNRKKVGEIEFSTEMQTITLPINTEFKQGINEVHLLFPEWYRHSEVEPDSTDGRLHSAKFSYIGLKESDGD